MGKNLVHAVKFFRYIFGASFEVEEVLGPMLTGRVSRVLATRKPTEQARALAVDEVKLLESRRPCEKNILDSRSWTRTSWGACSSLCTRGHVGVTRVACKLCSSTS